MRKSRLCVALVFGLVAVVTVYAQDVSPLAFEPKVGVTGTRITVKGPFPKGAQVKFGNRVVPVLVEPNGRTSFVVPETGVSSFIDVVSGGKTVARSAVPFVVAGSSLINTPKLIGLREAIDVFGYSEPVPSGGGKPEQVVRPVLKLDDQAILTIGEPLPQRLGPAVELGDLATAAKGPLGMAGFLITARPPVKKPKPAPAETAPPD
ncbi:MAG TPA: hypothetical protein VF580_04350 [Thermoanaerobaculia bacterium]